MRARDVRRFVGIHETPIGIGIGIVICAIASALLWHEGVKRGHEDQRLTDLHQQKMVVQKLIAKHSAELAAAKKAAAALVAAADSAVRRRNLDRRAFELRGDTAVTASDRQVLLPEIASFIRSSDFAAPKEAAARMSLTDVIEKQDTLVADHVKRELIDDEQTRILERQAHPRCGFKCGALVGAAVTLGVIRIVLIL
jgi:hypothetical protein